MHSSKLFSCRDCQKSQVCCTGLDIVPIPLLKKDLHVFKEHTLSTPSGNVIRPTKDGTCPFLTDDRMCSLIRKDKDLRPIYCRVYPLVGDGERILLDIFCPCSPKILEKHILGDTASHKFLVRARKLLGKYGEKMALVVGHTIAQWEVPITIDLDKL